MSHQICIRRAGTPERCPATAVRWAPYCHKCVSVLRKQFFFCRDRAVRYVTLDARAAALPAEDLIARVESDDRPPCVFCRQKAKLTVGGRFCSKGCAERWAVSLTQTKEWDGTAWVDKEAL